MLASGNASLLSMTLLTFAASLAVPTLVYVLARSRHPKALPPGRKVAAWISLWIGQVAAITGIEVWGCLQLAADLLRQNLWLLAGVYGFAMATMAAALTPVAVRTFVVGLVVLRTDDETRIAAVGKRLFRFSTAGLLIVLGYLWLLGRMGIPGRWNDLVYIALVLLPMALACAGLLTANGLVAWTHRPATSLGPDRHG